ncbi:DNA polymerase III subunit beta [Stappia aggregata IAM 12614]|uniref:Beta sliding clamp n=1 Tax=Roseibium aggregatum (strain ATCC 25650 / DSM 13394 / JCM 20685 / NBRC 16684 / NCIMB 2208 / IAM 12614 / B1) TaxID=384765 RepID=A0NQ72_ROSAI|nr:DNA polymerase III subunit beta [Roseibium aggregatum]EAV44930.1 DNA polymerase III subunit beta [Stappia aggregata IAM 12614] [Roseibium aggregatum IAM 12614]
MLIETTAGELKTALMSVKPAIQRRSTLPILSAVLIEDGAVIATDLDMEIRVKFAVKKCEGSAVIPFNQLYDLVRLLPADRSVRLQDTEYKNGGVFVTFQGGRYFLPSYSVVDYPRFSMPEDVREIASPQGLLVALEACQSFMSTEETRYYLNGVCFGRDKDDTGVLVATDGHRLIAHDYAHDCDGSPILPRAMIVALLRLCEPEKVLLHEQKMEFVLPGGGYLRCKLIDGTFPDWQRVVPTIPPGSPRLFFEPLEMVSILNRLELGRGCRKRAGASFCVDIATNAAGDLAIVSSEGMGGEECAERIESGRAIDWTKLSGGIWSGNSGYIKELCRLNFSADQVELTAEGSGTPTVMRHEESKALMVIMPMRGGKASTSTSLLALSRGGDNDADAVAQVA